MRVLILSHDDVERVLTPGACRDTMAEALAAYARGQAEMPLRSTFAPPQAGGLVGLMPSWHAGDGERPAAFSLKAICVMPGNPGRGLDAHQGTVTLFDGDTGAPTAILDASAITAVRTAAVTAVATQQLARPGARVLAILGAGVQADAHLTALLGACAFQQVRIHAPRAERVTALIARASEREQAQHAELTAAPSAEAAVRGADVVVTATSAREPVLQRDWLAPGAHVNAVGASIPSARELDVATVAAAALFVDSRESLQGEAGEYRLAVEQKAIPGESHVRATLGEVLAGIAPGRRDERELTLFRSLGLAVEDQAAAELAVAVAREMGIGTEVTL